MFVMKVLLMHGRQCCKGVVGKNMMVTEGNANNDITVTREPFLLRPFILIALLDAFCGD